VGTGKVESDSGPGLTPPASASGNGAGAPGAGAPGAGAPDGTAIVGAVDKGSLQALFTVDTKGYDPLNRAFHRVNFVGYDRETDKDTRPLFMSKVPPSGKGYDCGCRSTEDFTTSALFDAIVDGVFEGLKSAMNSAVPGSKEAFEALKKKVKEETGRDFEEDLKRFLANAIEGLFFRSYMVHIPSWAPVNRKGYGPDFDSANAHNVVRVLGADGKEKTQESEVEVEGFLHRSYLTRIHRPYTQWSNFYHWSFQVKPARGFKHLVGLGDIASESERKAATDFDEGERRPSNDLYLGPRTDPRIASDSSLECLFDIGAFSKPPGDTQPLDVFQHPSILFDKSWPFWPQTGDYFWAAGRFVYDCTHPTDKDKKTGLHPTVINPVKAFAVSRYEAFRFDGFDGFVPATRFLFVATRKGGYFDLDDASDIKINDHDYEFIVDLPPLEEDFGEFALGRTPQFLRNTLVVRPRLLKAIDFAPFRAGFDSPLRFARIEPILQLVRPEPGKLPRQVRVRVPMKTFNANRGDDFDAMGFVLTFGWHDERQLAKVKKVAVQLSELRIRDRNEQLRFNACVNGRWVFFATANPGGSANAHRFLNVRDGKHDHPGPEGIVLHLPDDAKVRISASGTKRNRQGEFIELRPRVDADIKKDRRLQVGGIIEIDDDTARIIREEIEKGLGRQIPEGFWKDFDKVKKVLNDENIKKILGNAAGDLLGQRRIVQWKRDVDSIEDDPKKQHQLATAIAREMKVFPVTNSTNEAMGLVEERLLPLQSPNSQTTVTMAQLVQRLQTNQPPLTAEWIANVAKHPEETGFMFTKLGKFPDDTDYSLKCTFTVSEPAENKAKP
jgi:hypothetical protein